MKVQPTRLLCAQRDQDSHGMLCVGHRMQGLLVQVGFCASNVHVAQLAFHPY